MMLRSGLMKAVRKIGKEKRIGILRYHSVADPEDNFYVSPGISLPPHIFERQVAFLVRRYPVVSLDDVALFLQGTKDLPKQAIVFTFDDGYADNYQAYKILKKYKAPGTFYISAGCIDQEPLWLFEVVYLVHSTSSPLLVLDIHEKSYEFSLQAPEQRGQAVRQITKLIKSNDLSLRQEIRSQLKSQTRDVHDFQAKAARVMLSWDQIREMSSSGMTIASHTMTHLNLPNAEPDHAWQEIFQSKKLLQDQIQQEVNHFSYPNGGDYAYYNQRIKDMVSQAGYTTATTSNNGSVQPGADPLELSRIRTTSHLAEIVYQIDCEPVLQARLARQ